MAPECDGQRNGQQPDSPVPRFSRFAEYSLRQPCISLGMDLDISKDGLPSANSVFDGYQNPELAPWSPYPHEMYAENTLWGNGSFPMADWPSSHIPTSGDFVSPPIWPAVEAEPDACEQHLYFPVGEDAISPTWSWSQPSSPVDTFNVATPPKRQSQRQMNSRSKQAARNSGSIVKSKPAPALHMPARKPRKTSTTTKTSPHTSMSSTRITHDVREDSTNDDKIHARRNHNIVEKQYRNRLNAQFDRLLGVLLPEEQKQPPPGGDDSDPDAERGTGNSSGAGSAVGERRLSKAEILDVATNRITELEADRARLLHEKKEILQSMEFLNNAGAGSVVRKTAQVGS